MVVSIHDNGGESFVKVVNQDRVLGNFLIKFLWTSGGWSMKEDLRVQICSRERIDKSLEIPCNILIYIYIYIIDS